jgi:EmrB/QacA subfamily drug resistance transporter
MGRPWIALITLSLGYFMTQLDMTIITVAIPTLSAKLHAPLDEVLWVGNAYTLVLAVLLITSGRLGDLFGARKLFIIGVSIFTVASILCAISQDAFQLIGARVLQGLGAAALIPQTMTIIIATFPAKRRGAALGVWGSVAALAAVAGPMLGGFLVNKADWRWMFLLNVPVGIVVLALAALALPATRQGMRRNLDVPSVLAASVALFCLAFGLIEGQRYSWNIGIWALLGGGVVFSIGFLLYQRTQQGREPLLPFSLFRDRNYNVATLVAATVSIGLTGLFLPLSIYLQSVLGYSGFKAGVVMGLASVVTMILAPVAGRLSDRDGGKYILMTGLALYGVGIAWVLLVANVGTQGSSLLPGLLVVGVGMGLLFPPMSAIAMRNVQPAMAGAASGAMNTIRQVGSVLGSAVIGAVLQNQLASSLRDEAVKQSAGLPANVRGPFVAGFKNAAKGGLQAGAGRSGSPHLPKSVPPQVAQRIQDAGASVFQHGFVHAMRPTMTLPLVVILAASASCLILKRHRDTETSEQAGTVEAVPAR